MKRYLTLLFLLPLFLSAASAQQYTREALRLGLISGVNLGGEEATIKYANYTPHPFGMFSMEYYAVDRLALAGSLYAGTLAADFTGRSLFPDYGRQPISSYDTKYYGLSIGVDYALPQIWELTPIGRARIGGMMHHTRVNGEGGFDHRLSQGALIWGLGGALEYPLSRVLNLTFSYDLILSNSDELDGLRSGKRNDALSLLTLGINVLLRPGEVPPPRARVYSTRTARITDQPARTELPRSGPEAFTEDRKSSPSDDRTESDARSDSRSGAEADRPTEASSPRVTRSEPADATPRETGLALSPDPPPPLPTEAAKENMPLRLYTQLSLIPIRRLRDLEDRPELFTLKAWQTGDDRMMLKSYVEMLRDGRTIYQGNADLLLDGPKDEYRADEFLDLDELLMRNQGDAPLPRGNYVVRVSTVEWNHELSSLSQAKFLNVDLRPIFAHRADTARAVIVDRAVDVTAEGDQELVVNFFAAGRDAAERDIPLPEQRKAERQRESLQLAPIGTAGARRDALISAEVQRAFAEALSLQNIAAAPGRPEHLKIIVSEVYFPVDTDLLSEESRILLDNVARQINQHPELFAEIRGYANDIGDETANRALANRRAQRVLEYLVRQKVSDYRLTVEQVNEEQLMTEPNSDPRLGRKVEILLKNRGM
ncbi:MAG: OmpA family protein [Bacteroidetes bacterium]|nr:OmpA family protein [Bacteroidota bacterium]